MRKVLSIFSILTMAIALTACGADEEKKSQKEDKAKTEVSDKHKEKSKENKKKEKEENKTQANEVTTNTDNSANQVTQEASETTDNTTNQGVQESTVSNQNNVSTQAPQQNQNDISQASSNYNQEAQANGKIDLNSMPATDFTTEGMSPQAQKEIEDLTYQKDFQGLPQEEYNNRVSDIMNRENGY
ncbi:hypothetical protein MUA19_10995 [Staphylococcus chromogenes]|uniref:hypothetical protein n=1 Tax=Staphylococcus chromogenes TaxID=46126 RepID=UPI0021D1E414|nr:hypothetical protein [Staphylococcus chromogenes]UXS67763.1 hypothetical protein MUA19_10995 [Staphylococcus chromogenes]